MKSVTSIIKSKWSLLKGVTFNFSEENQIPNSSLFNPYTKELVSNKPYLKKDELITKLSMAAVSFRKWKDVPLNNRVELVKKFVGQIISQKDILKPLISQQLGKSYKNIDEQFRRIEKISESLIESGRNCLKSQIIDNNQQKIKKVAFEPVGLTLLFPYFSQPIFDSLINLIPCLISGNGALLKSSDFNHFLGPYLQKKAKQVFGRSALVADIFIEPNHLIDLAQFRAIKKVLYSGTPDSARHIFQTLIQNRFIDCNLFFGGKDAAYVDQKCDLEFAAREIVNNSFYNNGQSYDCIKRLYLHKNIEEKFLEILVNQISKIKVGNPAEGITDLGPLCVPQNANIAEQLINESISEGASCLIGGLTASDGQGPGVFFEPTLLSNCTNDMIVVQTQINAPILCAIPLGDQSIFDQINQSDFGTGVRIFSNQEDKYKDLLGKLELGRIAFNSGSLFDKNLPIEGWKQSGKGKLLSELAYQEFSIPKSYNIKKL